MHVISSFYSLEAEIELEYSKYRRDLHHHLKNALITVTTILSGGMAAAMLVSSYLAAINASSRYLYLSICFILLLVMTLRLRNHFIVLSFKKKYPHFANLITISPLWKLFNFTDTEYMYRSYIGTALTTTLGNLKLSQRKKMEEHFTARAQKRHKHTMFFLIGIGLIYISIAVPIFKVAFMEGGHLATIITFHLFALITCFLYSELWKPEKLYLIPLLINQHNFLDKE